VRVSTEEQAERGLSLGAQRETCRAYAERVRWPISAECADEGVSAGKPLHKRPGLVAAIGALSKDDVLLVAKRDRLYRADPYECAVIERAIKSRGARFVSVAGEGTSDDSPSSILMGRILDAMAEHERLLASVRTQAVMAAKRARGERLGQIPYGWRLHDDGKTLVIDPEEQVAIETIFRRTREGASLRAIARELDACGIPPKRASQWHASSVTLPLGANAETIGLIHRLGGAGLSPRKIASELNRRGIPDCRPAKWSATCVARILKSCPPERAWSPTNYARRS
jgi:site-specific DNA recombinase